MKKSGNKFKVESSDDIWYLSHIITEGDILSGTTFRKIKIGTDEERNKKVVRKPLHIKIRVEKIDYKPEVLRVSGTVTEASEEVIGHHTFNISEGTEFKLFKEKYYSYQKEKLKEATEEKPPSILMVALDREEAYFAVMKREGYKTLGSMKGEVQKKGYDQNEQNFYAQVYKAVKDYDDKYNFENIIIASPAFFKEDFMKEAADLEDKITLATCSTVGPNSFSELLKREELKNVLRKDKISKEMEKVQKLMTEISKDNKVAYGLDETKQAAMMGAVKELYVSDKLIRDMREKDNFSKLDGIMQNVDNSRGEVHIISSDHDGGRQLDGLGGIGGLLRYRIN